MSKTGYALPNKRDSDCEAVSYVAKKIWIKIWEANNRDWGKV
jgi:hypothetical protein